MINYCSECKDFPGRGERCQIEGRVLRISANKGCSSFCRKQEVEVVKENEPLFPETKYIEIIKTDKNGEQTVIDRTLKISHAGIAKVLEIIELEKTEGVNCPYSFRYV